MIQHYPRAFSCAALAGVMLVTQLALPGLLRASDVRLRWLDLMLRGASLSEMHEQQDPYGNPLLFSTREGFFTAGENRIPEGGTGDDLRATGRSDLTFFVYLFVFQFGPLYVVLLTGVVSMLLFTLEALGSGPKLRVLLGSGLWAAGATTLFAHFTKYYSPQLEVPGALISLESVAGFQLLGPPWLAVGLSAFALALLASLLVEGTPSGSGGAASPGPSTQHLL